MFLFGSFFFVNRPLIRHHLSPISIHSHLLILIVILAILHLLAHLPLRRQYHGIRILLLLLLIILAAVASIDLTFSWPRQPKVVMGLLGKLVGIIDALDHIPDLLALRPLFSSLSAAPPLILLITHC